MSSTAAERGLLDPLDPVQAAERGVLFAIVRLVEEIAPETARMYDRAGRT
jgi:hypothetical protein